MQNIIYYYIDKYLSSKNKKENNIPKKITEIHPDEEQIENKNIIFLHQLREALKKIKPFYEDILNHPVAT